MVENVGPIRNGHGPAFGNVTMGQVKQLADGLVGWEHGLIFGDFAQLAVVGLNTVIGLDQPPNFRREVEKAGQLRPVGFPGAHGHSIFVGPFFTEAQ